MVGIDTACGAEGGSLGAFNWRGKGLLRLVSSHWEVLGWGYAEGGERSEPQSLSTQPEAASDSLDPPPSTTQPSDNNKEEDAWMITWFGKTVFTPAGIDVYARTKAGHAGWVVEKIREALAGMEEEGMRKLGGELFEVVRE